MKQHMIPINIVPNPICDALPPICVFGSMVSGIMYLIEVPEPDSNLISGALMNLFETTPN